MIMGIKNTLLYTRRKARGMSELTEPGNFQASEPPEHTQQELPPEEDYKQCRNCEGKGKTYMGRDEGNTCQRCRGTGKEPVCLVCNEPEEVVYPEGDDVICKPCSDAESGHSSKYPKPSNALGSQPPFDDGYVPPPKPGDEISKEQLRAYIMELEEIPEGWFTLNSDYLKAETATINQQVTGDTVESLFEWLEGELWLSVDCNIWDLYCTSPEAT